MPRVKMANADKKNPFSLAKVAPGGGEAKPYLAKTYSEADKDAMLQQYMELPKDLWPSMRAGQHVRYVTTEGEFRPGGFVATAHYESKGTGAEMKPFVMLQNSFDARARNYAKWPVAYENIAHLYAKADVTTLLLQRQLENVVAGFNTQLKRLAEQVKILKAAK